MGGGKGVEPVQIFAFCTFSLIDYPLGRRVRWLDSRPSSVHYFGSLRTGCPHPGVGLLLGAVRWIHCRYLTGVSLALGCCQLS